MYSYGERIFNYENRKDAPLLEKYLASDDMDEIMNPPENISDGHIVFLVKNEPDEGCTDFPFFCTYRHKNGTVAGKGYKYLREIVEDEGYRPYKNEYELLEDMKNHSFGTSDSDGISLVRSIIYDDPEYDGYKLEVSLKRGGVVLLSMDRYSILPFEDISFERFFDEYVWEDDGSPCGVKNG